MEIEGAIQSAMEAAEKAPEEFREATFRVVLHHILANRMAGVVSSSREVSLPEEESTEGLPEWLRRIVDNMPEAHLLERGSRVQQTMWAVLRLSSREVAVTTEEIMKTIKTELGITPQNKENTARTLRELTPRFVMREDRSDGRGYVYKPTVHCLEVFADLVA